MLSNSQPSRDQSHIDLQNFSEIDDKLPNHSNLALQREKENISLCLKEYDGGLRRYQGGVETCLERNLEALI